MQNVASRPELSLETSEQLVGYELNFLTIGIENNEPPVNDRRDTSSKLSRQAKQLAHNVGLQSNKTSRKLTD